MFSFLSLFQSWAPLRAGALWKLELFESWSSLRARALWELELFESWSSLSTGSLWELELYQYFNLERSLIAGFLSLFQSWELELFGSWSLITILILRAGVSDEVSKSYKKKIYQNLYFFKIVHMLWLNSLKPQEWTTHSVNAHSR
jgi:hypothetical protein